MVNMNNSLNLVKLTSQIGYISEFISLICHFLASSLKDSFETIDSHNIFDFINFSYFSLFLHYQSLAFVC